MTYIIATSRSWYKWIAESLARKLKVNVHCITKKEELNIDYIQKLNPKYIFFPHWSYIIPPSIYENFECVIFHMTDVPFGRGGSPLQNLIARGIYETKITALRCEKELDAGPVYLKRPFSLYGAAEEIYMRASKVIEEMIEYIIKNQPEPKKQEGDVVYFKRRTPAEGNLSNLSTLERVFDYIRMLDADGYPKAFVETEHFIFEFERATLKENYVHADVKIRLKRSFRNEE
jgi:methionyl-tRNA formyltransferase